jgi:hypothetical protein
MKNNIKVLKTFIPTKYFILFLYIVFLSLFFEAPVYAQKHIEVLQNNAEIKANPNITAKTTHNTFKGIIFPIKNETNSFYQIQLLNLSTGWIKKTSVKIYESNIPPSIEKIGIATKHKKPTKIDQAFLQQLLNETQAAPTPLLTETIKPGKPTINLTKLTTPNSSIENPSSFATTTPPNTTTINTIPTQNTPKLAPWQKENKPLNNLSLNPSENIIGTSTFDMISNPKVDNFLYPPQQNDNYPDLNIAGFYEGKLSQRNYNPKSPTSSVWETIRKDPIYNKLPRDVLLGPAKFDMRYKFNIDGQLSKDLSVHYDVEQEPDFPGKYDIRVKHKKTELTFYHFDAEFKNGDFINVKKALNGAMVESYTDSWEGKIAIGRQRSDPKKFESWGNGGTKYSLGHGNILEDSVRVWVNNSTKAEHTDYEVNFYEGSITFNSPKNQTDYIEIVYEFTNPIEDFIPVLSRKNFIGAQYLWHDTTRPEVVKTTGFSSKTITITTSNIHEFSDNTIQLEHTNLVVGSISLSLNDRILKKNISYALKHNTGKLNLLNVELMENDKLYIAYSYYKTADISENLIGKDSPGPYFLKEQNIIQRSIKVSVDDIPLSETIDYDVNYKEGSLFFNYSVEYPRIISVEYSSIQSETTSSNSQNSPLHYGVTYLQEYVHGQEEELVKKITDPEAFGTSSNIVQTKFSPLRSTKDIVIKVKLPDESMATVDFKIVNTYKGIIEILGAGPYTGTITYSYGKSFKTSYVFYGNESYGQETAPYIGGYEPFTIRDLPMKYGGSEYIRLFNAELGERILEKNRDFSITYGEDGTSPELRFYLNTDKNSGHTASQLSSYPDKSTRMQLVYEYAPEVSPDVGDINQRMIGLTFGTKLTDKWSIDTELVAADHNFSKPRVSHTDSMDGNGSNDAYSLSHNNLVEDSEFVFMKAAHAVNTSNVLVKDRDYLINYITGQIKFLNITPKQGDKISVEYKYYDNTGTMQSGEQHNFKIATKVSTQYKDDDITIKGDLKTIDKDFLPIGEIKDAKGSTIMGGSLDWKINETDNFFIDFHRRDEYKGTKSEGEDTYLHTNDLKTNTKIDFFDSFFETDQSFRYQLRYQDPINTSGTKNHDVDDLTLEYQGVARFGPDYFKNSLTTGWSEKHSDYIDMKEPGKTQATNFQYESLLNLPDVYILGDTLVSPKFSESKTISNKRAQLPNNAISEQWSKSTRTSKGLNSKFKPIKNLNLIYNISEDIIRTDAHASSKNESVIENNYYKASYSPYTWFNTEYDKRHQENESPLINQKGKIDDQSNFRISRFAPMGVFKLIGAKDTNPILYPIATSHFTFQTSNKKTLENNYQKSFYSHSDRYNYHNFRPLPGITLTTVSYETRHSILDNNIISKTSSGNTSLSEYTNKSGSLNIKPPIPILNLFTYNLNLQKRKDYRKMSQLSQSSTSNVIIDLLPLDSKSEDLSFNPGNIVLHIPKLLRFNFGKLSASAKRDFRDITNTQTTTTYAPLSTTPASNITRADNSFTTARLYTINTSPLNLFSLNAARQENDEIYSRNINPSNTGYTLKYIRNNNINSSYSPFSFISFSGSYADKKTYQYLSDDINSTTSGIKKAYNNNNYLSLANEDLDITNSIKNYLNQRSRIATLGSTFTPFSFISFRGQGSLNNIKDFSRSVNHEEINNFQEIINDFLQEVGTAGVEVRPLSGLSISYDYSLKFTSKNKGTKEKGYSGITKASYIPIQTKNFKININYSRSDTWGEDLNVLTQQTSEQGTGDSLRTDLVHREDTVEIGSLSIDISIPLDSSPYIDRLVITGEGYLKKVTDKLDNTRPETEHNSYEVSGMVIKATLMF